MAELPANITVGPYTYTVSIDRTELDADRVGQTDHTTQTIIVDDRQAPDQLADTLLHEVLHALWDMTGLAFESKPGVEEATIRRLTPALLLVIRTNPKLVKYLTTS